MKDTSAEDSRARMMAHTMPSNMYWTMPPENASGRSATQSMKVIASTASRTSLMPSIAASLGDLPMRRCRSIEWMSMIESSTSRPMDSSSPISVELFSVIPKGTMARSAMPSETGMVMTEMSVPRMLPRKNRTTTPVRRIGHDQLLHHVVHQEADERGVVVGRLESEPREVLPDLLELGLDVLDHLHRAGVRLLDDRDLHRLLAVQPVEAALLAGSVHDLRHVAEIHGPPVHAGDRVARDFLRRAGAKVAPHQELAVL